MAVIAVAGVLLAGLVAAVSSYWTASKTIESNRTIELDKYRRQEAEQAYLQYVKAINEYSQKAAEIAVAYSSYATHNNPYEFSGQVGALNDARNKVDDATYLVELVAPKTIRQQANDIRKRVGDLGDVAFFSLEPWYDKTRDREADINQRSHDFYVAYNPLFDQIKALTDAMRLNLGIAGD